MALLTKWTTPVEIAGTGQMSAQQLNEQMLQNLLFLFGRQTSRVSTHNATDWDTTSTTPVKADSSRYLVQLDTKTGNINIDVNFVLKLGVNDITYAGLLIDDDWMYGDPTGAGGTAVSALYSEYSRDVETYRSWIGSYKLIGLTAGIHTVEPMVWVSSGTGGIKGANGANLFTNEITLTEF